MTETPLRTLFLGAPENFRIEGNTLSELAQRIERAVRHACVEHSWRPPEEIIMPRLNFTIRIITDPERETGAVESVRFSTEPADGVVVTDPGRAAAITLADCLGICLTYEKRLALLHGGLRCLVRPDGSSIIMEAVRISGFSPSETRAWIGAGIGPCCYGLDIVPAGTPPENIAKPARGPRADKPFSIDLRSIVRTQLTSLGVPIGHITIDPTCTACLVKDSGFPFWSHVRGDRERNLFVVWHS